MSELYTDPTLILAKFLHGGHIDTTIRFKKDHPAWQMFIVVTGELRQVYHHGGETVIHIGIGAEDEYMLDPETPIVLNPSDTWADWPMFMYGTSEALLDQQQKP